MFLLFNMLSRLVIAFLPRSKCLLISWPQLLSAVILEGHWQQQSWKAHDGISHFRGHIQPYHRVCRLQGWAAKNREGTQPHSSAGKVKGLLNMTLSIKARLSFSHNQPLLSESLHKPLIHQRADRSKNYNPMASRNKTQSQKPNQNDHMDHSLV